MSHAQNILSQLADGHFHSGEDLGQRLGVSRAAIWKYIKQLRQLGVEVSTVPGRGYRIQGGLELLDRKKILEAGQQAFAQTLSGLDILSTVDSTNQWLLARAKQGCPSGFAVLAEHQTAGRGRQGKAWVSPFGCNLYLSLYWRFEVVPSALAGLSLVMGMAVVDALRAEGLQAAKLKWPNDIWVNDQKLGGILIEMFGDVSGPCDVVIGVGLNVHMNSASHASSSIDQAWTSLAQLQAKPVSRNLLAAMLLTRLIDNIHQFSSSGLAPFLTRWSEYDALHQTEVRVKAHQNTFEGKAVGVTESGELLVQSRDQCLTFDSAHISVRRKKT